MRKRELKAIARNKERFSDIVKLLKNKEYDKIYETYGQRVYSFVVPSYHKKKDINRLMKEGKFEDIYWKYGEGTYNDYVYKMQQIDVYNETGSKFKSAINRIKNVVSHRIVPILISTAIALPATGAGLAEIEHRKQTIENAEKYSEKIKNYDEKTQKYAESIKSMNLTDIQIFMKTMRDMWREIDGYASPKNEIMGLARLSLEDEKIGVCRNFADYMTAQLNAINPEYNARNVVVYLNGDYSIANIERTIIEDNETIKDNEEEQNRDETNLDITKVFGNHMVSAVDIPNENITLILDPTNPSIGVFKDGKIYMFSNNDGKGLETKGWGQIISGGIESVLDIDGTKLKSFLPTKYSLEELEKKYGTYAQNQALAYLDNLEKDEKTEFIAKVKVNEAEALENAKMGNNNHLVEEKTK